MHCWAHSLALSKHPSMSGLPLATGAVGPPPPPPPAPGSPSL